MQRINNQKQTKGKRRSKRRNQAKGWRQTPGHTYVSHFSPAFAPTMPREFSVALAERSFQQLSAITVPTQFVYSTLEFLGRTPTYLTELYAIYKYARVTAITLEVKIVNLASAPVEAVIAVLPFSEITGFTLEKAVERPGSVRRVVSGAGGIDQATLKKTITAESAFGQPYLDRDFWIDSSQATSITPLDSREPAIVAFVQGMATAASVTYNIETRATFHCQFFDLRTVAST